MDNITHSVVGLAVAEWSVRAASHKSGRSLSHFRSWLWLTALLGGNFPDLDFLYVQLTTGKLGYLLHHRGHTHTLIMVLPQALVILAVVLRLASFHKAAFDRWERGWLWVTALTGPVIHIGLDSLNSYGVHPFWPIDNRWYFGDTFFIVEPWAWVTLIPGLVALPVSRTNRSVLSLCVWVGLGLSWGMGLVPPVMSLALTLTYVLETLYCRKHRRISGISIGLLSLNVVLFTFALTSKYVRGQVNAQAEVYFPKEQHLDLALTPFPVNPFCWSVVAVSTDESVDAYHVRSAVFTPFPRVLDVASCPRFRETGQTLSLTSVAVPRSENFRWLGEHRLSLQGLRTLAARHCGFRAFLQFSRVPYFLDQGENLAIGDVRFDREVGFGFAEMQMPSALKETVDCPKYLPPWVPPRRDLLGFR